MGLTAACIVLAALNAAIVYIVWDFDRRLQYQQEQLHTMWATVFGPDAAVARLEKQAREERGAPLLRPRATLPPPGPPPDVEPSPYGYSTLPEELAAVLENQERETDGASSQRLCSWVTEQDERDAELEDTYTSDLAVRIRALSGDNC